MLSTPFWVVGFVSLALGATLAQDPTKVEPTHYKLAFENEWVQVVDVHYGPHEKSRMHDHPGGVVVVLTEGHLKFTDQHGKVHEVYANPGESRWFPATHAPSGEPGRYRLQRGLRWDQDQTSIGQGWQGRRAPSRGCTDGKDFGFSKAIDAC